MSRCENCGTAHKAGIHFCTQCGRVLPTGNAVIRVDPKNLNAAFSKFTAGDFFGVAGSTRPADFKPVPQTQRPNQHTGDATRSGRVIARADVLKTVARVAALAILKSLALSAAVLGPGVVLLVMGMAVPGMIWLFCGSFAMMAWTYRKPWRLGLIACLIPPVAAALCYLVQLMIFGGSVPPLLFLGGAMVAGAVVGIWRAQTHSVTRAEDGGIVAKRTIGYLLVWVAAYAGTQLLSFVATNALVLRAGLLTGAFSTAMLAVVSIVIWAKFRALRQVAIAFILVIAGLTFQPVDAALAQSGPCAGLFSGSGNMQSRLELACASHARDGIADRELLKMLSYETSGTQGFGTLTVQADKAKSRGDARGAIDLLIRAFNEQDPDNLPGRRNILESMINVAQQNYTPEIGRIVTPYGEKLTQLKRQYCATEMRGYANLPKFAREYENAKSCVTYMDAILAQAGQTAQPSVQPGAVAPLPPSTTPPVPSEQAVRPGNLDLDTPICWHNLGAGFVGPSPDAAIGDPQCDFTMTCRQAREADRAGGAVEYRDLKYGGTGSGSINHLGICETVATPPPGVFDPLRPPQPGDVAPISPEEAAAATAAIAAILIAAGLTASVAQAIAAALANALQAGVQLTMEELQQAIADALRDMVGLGQAEQPDSSNAPPNVAFTDRFRDPTESTDGQNTGPETTSDPVPRANAQPEHAEPPPPVDTDEHRRRQLETGIRNTLAGMPPDDTTQALANRLEQAANGKNRWELEDIWDQVREQRQAQIAASEREAAQHNAAARLAQKGETIAGAVLMGAKAAGAAGLGVVTGGTASVVQGVVGGVIGTGALIAIGGVEGGVTAKGGEIAYDLWQAARGAARGALDAAGALTGGVAAGGSKVIAAAKTVFATTSTYGRTFADSFDQTGDRELAHNRAVWSAGADALKTAGGEYLDEKSRIAGQRGEAQKVDGTRGDHAVGDKSVEAIIDARTQANQTRIAAAKTAGNLVGKTLGNIASSDKDLTTEEAAIQAGQSELLEQGAAKLAGLADAGGNQPMTAAQRAVLDRWDAERSGAAPPPAITPDYAAHLDAKGGIPSDYVPASDALQNNGNFTSAAQRHVQAVADSHGVKIIARTVDAEAAIAIANGEAHPKPETMKANTGSDADVLLGMDPAHVNRVVVFPPELPDRAAAVHPDGTPLNDSEWEGLQRRAQSRQDLYDEYSAKIPQGDEFTLDGHLVRNKQTGLPYVGDMDVFAVRGLYSEPLPKAVTNQVMTDLISAKSVPGETAGSTVEHFDHMSWDIASLDNTKLGYDGKTARERAIETNARILNKIKPGAEPMAVFTGRPGVTPPRATGTFYQGPGPKTE